ncbi:MAG TPA: PQQ-binding-like beta-propeller repeat protein [Anaerolineales bacterium]|nr:PQQ-binding-like beta-propeller repeat protein [Anaerolineales bacterium]
MSVHRSLGRLGLGLAIILGTTPALTRAQAGSTLYIPNVARTYRPSALSALGAGDWSQEAHDAQRTGFVAVEPKTPWTLLWTFNASDSSGGASCPGGDPTRGHCYNAPEGAHTVVGGDAVYVPAGANGLYALNAGTGAVLWRVTGVTFNATPAYSGGFVYAGSADGRLFKVDAATGATTTYTAGSPLNRGILIADGAAFALADNGELHKVALSSLTRQWVYAAGASATEGTGLAYSASRDVIIFGTNDLYVHAVRDVDGVRKWRVKPSPNPAGFPNQFLHYWPVVAERNGLVFIRMRIDHNAGLWDFPTVTSNAAARQHLVANPAHQNLFALNLDDGSKKFIPAVGYGGTEDTVAGANTCAAASCPYLTTGPAPVIKVWPDGTEVAYIPFRNNQGNTSDARWNSHLGEMVLNDATVSGMVAGDLRFVRMGRDSRSYIHVADEQNPLTMAGNAILHAHWGASEGVTILDRSSGRGGSYANPITTTALPPVVRRMQACSGFNAATHATSCGMTLYGETRYWQAPGFWTYWNAWDPPTPTSAANAYSEGLGHVCLRRADRGRGQRWRPDGLHAQRAVGP